MTSAELKARVLAAARDEPSPTRDAASRRTWALVALAVAVDVAVFFLVGGANWQERPPRFIVLTQAGSAAIALVAAWGAFGRGRSMLGRPRPWMTAIAIATPVALFAWTLVGNLACPETLDVALRGRIGLRCCALLLGFAVWALPLIAYAMSDKYPTAAAATGAARAVAVGAFAWVLLAFWCPIATPAHIALGHFLPLLILAGFGAWLGKRTLDVVGKRRR